jgi:hypothetical protein
METQIMKSIGNPWQSQWGFNPSKQNDITDWKQVFSLIYPTDSAASLVTKNYIYILGGFNRNVVSNIIQRASFDNNGDLIHSWINAGILPISLRGMGYVAAKNRIYLIGGCSHFDSFFIYIQLLLTKMGV